MNSKKEFIDKLDEIREKSIIEVSEWWGLQNAGYRGIIITEDKDIYEYQYYNNIPKELEGKNVNFISKNKSLNENGFSKITKFIEDEVINNEFKDEMIFDAGFDVTINYLGVRKKIKNNKGFKDDMKIYDKAKKLIDELLSK